MDAPLASLIAASVTFAGTHFALSHPLRAPIVQRIGAAGFQALYSLVAFASFAWMVIAFRAVHDGAALWDGSGSAAWVIASALTLLAAVLLVGSFAGNPALPAPGAAALAQQPVHGVFHVTRHPMMWSFALWAAAHILVSPTPRVVVLAGTLGLLALVGAHLQDRKKEALMGAAWRDWEGRTSYWPRLGQLGKAGTVPWLGGIALWFAATWAHVWLDYVPAGIWRWMV